MLALSKAVVILGWQLVEHGDRPLLEVRVRTRKHRKGRCGRCGRRGGWYDKGDGERRWRTLDVGFARCVLVADAPRVNCPTHGPVVAAVPWARHASAFTQPFEDVVVWDAIASNKSRAAQRHDITWSAVNNACRRVLQEALERTDLLDGLIAIGIDEVKFKKGHKYLTVVTDHVTSRVVWAIEGRSKATVNAFLDALGPSRLANIQFVTCDGADWIHTVLAERVPEATVCLDTFHLIKWATDALDQTRREQWNALRQADAADKAKNTKGLRFLLVRNWENLTHRQQDAIRALEKTNKRLFRAWQLKEELRDIMSMGIIAAKAALDEWLRYASRSRLPAFVKLARTVRHYRQSIEATIEWRLTNGLAESANAAIGRLRTNARGFHTADALIDMILLDRADLAPTLPWKQAS